MNNLTIAGALGRDAETRTTQTGETVTGFSVAVNEGKDKTTWSPENLKRLIDYDPLTGSLTWKPRDGTLVRSGKVSEARRWNGRYAGSSAFTAITSGGYLSGAIHKRSLLAHVVAWVIAHGEWPSGEIDHIDGDRTNNRLCNLRCVSPAENKKNRAIGINNTSGRLGVSYNARDNRWAAYIGTGVRLGTFRNIEDAVSARAEAEARLGYHENHGRLPK